MSVNKGFQVFGGTVNIGAAAVGDGSHAEADDIHQTKDAGSQSNDVSGSVEAHVVVQARDIGRITFTPPSEPGEPCANHQ